MRHGLVTLLMLAGCATSLAQDPVAGKCMLSLLLGFQEGRQHCDVSSPEMDAAIDKAVPIIEARLIALGEVTAEQLVFEREQNRALWATGGIFAAETDQACASVDFVRWGMTAQSVADLVVAVQSAAPEMFSDDCI